LTITINDIEKLPIERLPDLLVVYKEDIQNYKKHLETKGKPIGEANRENASWLAFYDERRIELRVIIKYIEMDIARVRGKLYKSFTEGYHVDLGERAKEKYIDQEEEYLKRKRALIQIEEMYEKYQSIVSAFMQRGYDLRNLTQLKVAAIDNVEI
jgi:hypothetical protein